MYYIENKDKLGAIEKAFTIIKIHSKFIKFNYFLGKKKT